MAALDASADWAQLWRQLSQLGWRQEQLRKSSTPYYIPPSMSSMQKSKSTQRDYYDTREQVREYLVGLRGAKSAAAGQRSRYDSSRGAADRPGKRDSVVTRPPKVRLASANITLCPASPNTRDASKPDGPPPTTRTRSGLGLDATCSGCHPMRHSSPIVGFWVQRMGTPRESWA